MGRAVAVTLVLCTILLVLADPLACPDGCSRSRGERSSQVSPFDVDICAWCLGIGNVYIESHLVASAGVISETSELAAPHPLLGSLLPIEHPPRA